MSEKQFKKDKRNCTIAFSIFMIYSILGIINSFFVENISKCSYVVMCLVAFLCSTLLLFITRKTTLSDSTNKE